MPWLDEKSPGPLSGVKVIDMSNVVFGPFGSQILGDLGADIIKIENGAGDLLRYVGPSHVKDPAGSPNCPRHRVRQFPRWAVSVPTCDKSNEKEETGQNGLFTTAHNLIYKSHNVYYEK